MDSPTKTVLHIKHMVCSRCIMVVNQVIGQAGFSVLNIELGKVEIEGSLPAIAKTQILDKLASYGFELLDDKRSQLVERIKTLIISQISNSKPLKTNLSEYLWQQIGQDYATLSKLFSESRGITIEKYYIQQRIERAKELLLYNELTLGQIAFALNYSSAAHLSRQFKQVTGLTPTQFKQAGGRRQALEEL